MPSEEILFSSDSLIELIKSAFSKNASFRFEAKGFSMFIFIKDGDVVTLSPPSVSPITLGKAVAFIRSSRPPLAIHRIIGRNKDCFIIKGDAADEPDGLIPKEDILGCVTRIERGGRDVCLGLGPERLIIAFLSRIGFFACVLWCWRLIPLPTRRGLKEWLAESEGKQ